MSVRGIASLNGSLTLSPHSHRSAWAKFRADQQAKAGHMVTIIDKPHEIDPTKFDEISLYWGMEFGGTLNLFGGANSDNAKRLGIPRDWVGKTVISSLDIEMPDVPALMRLRYEKGDEDWRQVCDDDLLAEAYKSARYLVQPHLPDLIVGDSHALSMYSGKEHVARHDGKTAHGASSTLHDLIPYFDAETIVLYFGNIDIRHHICREAGWRENVPKTVVELVQGIKQIDLQQDVTLIAPMPIENEARKIPGTGHYRGTPFFGAWAERNDARKYWTDLLVYYAGLEGWKVLGWDEAYWCNGAGELDFERMERPGSVHLSWAESRLNRTSGTLELT